MGLAPPIPVILPLLVAALLAALNRRIPRGLASGAAIATALASGAAAAAILRQTRAAPVVYWFGGWTPRSGLAPGVAFTIDEAGAALTLAASILLAAALIFSSRYFDTVGTLYHSLMLIFLAALDGFASSGDLFNMFVFFELMSAAAYALCGYKSEEPGPLQGALNFAVTNTLGAFLVLTGLALLYGRAGALNLAQIGRAIEGRADALVAVAFALIVSGFFVKAAIVPFHFWLADAHAVAPAPVCALYSGVMVELGLYAVVRVYWAVFSGALPADRGGLQALLAAFGGITALAGAVMCFAQRHLKRLLAFSTISHMGILLLGVAPLTPDALAGVGIYAAGHAMLKGGLFLAAGILLHRAATVDEIDLHRRPPPLPGVAALLLAGAAGLAGAPPFGTFRGDAMIAAAARRSGHLWMPWIALIAAVITAAALFRFTARALFGWGPAGELFGQPGSKIHELPDTQAGRRRTPVAMWLPASGLLALALAPALPSLAGRAEIAALRIQNREAYAARVLEGRAAAPASPSAGGVGGGDLLRGAASLAAGLALAGFALRSRAATRARWLRAAIHGLRSLHSGIIPDYVAWMMAGVAALCLAALFGLRPY